MEETTRVTIRLPRDMVKRLEMMIAMGKYDNLSEAVRDCIQEYLDSNHIEIEEMDKGKVTVDMETLIEDGNTKSMDELIREAAKKYTKDHLEH